MKLSRRLGLLAVAVAVLALGAAAAGYALFFSPQASARQPIAFSHRLHAEEKQIACVYCHQGVTKSPVAGLPSVEKCMACHQTVAADRPEVRKIAAFWEKKEPIAWARVSYLPDHVYFTHEMHVRAGLECRACHGTPRTSDGSFARLEPGMAWCLDCHKQKGASIDCATCHQ